MKRVFALIVSMLFVVQGVALADHPCKAIEEACKKAGFVRGEAKEGKGLFKNCMKPLMEGQAVAGVSVPPAEIQACQAKKAEHEHMHSQPETPPAPAPAPH